MNALIPFVLAASLAAPALADHINDHDPCDPVFPAPLPGQEHFSGGAAWVSAIGPIGGSEVTNARFDITYVSDGETPASEMLLNVGMWVDTKSESIYVETIVTGADLGFGSGAGTFHGTFETTVLNGVAVEHFLVAPNSLIDVIIDASGGGGIQGTAYFVDSAILFDVIPAGPCCPADLDGDGSVGFADLVAILEAWGPCPGCDADINESGVVGLEDLLTVLSDWGGCE
jgi:hypothetical protein